MDKRSLSEADICSKFITPAILEAGWKSDTQIREQVYFTIMVKEKMRGQAYPAINDSDLKALRIQVPTLGIQKKTMEWAKDLIFRFDELIACNQNLKVLNLKYLIAQANSLGLDFQESEKA